MSVWFCVGGGCGMNACTLQEKLRLRLAGEWNLLGHCRSLSGLKKKCGAGSQGLIFSALFNVPRLQVFRTCLEGISTYVRMYRIQVM